MMLTGYPPEDLVLRPSFRAASRATLDCPRRRSRTRPGSARSAVVVGYLDDDHGPRNAAAFLLGGRVVATYFKHHLPNYGVFDEHRYFGRGDRFTVVRLHGLDIALTICEDAWQDGGPFAQAREVGVDLIVNINGSPYERNKDDVRLPLVQRRAIEAGAPVAYVNTVGAQDELVFDGDSFVVGAERRGDLAGPAVRSRHLLHRPRLPGRARPTADADAGPMRVERHDTAHRRRSRRTRPSRPCIAERSGDEAEVWAALVTGVRDYVAKNGFRSVVLGHVRWHRLGRRRRDRRRRHRRRERVRRLDAERVLLGPFQVRRGRPGRTPRARTTARCRSRRWSTPSCDGLGLTGLAEENVQARVRGTTLMAISNSEGHLVLATGNKSELAVGYSTIYGDAVGGYAPIKDVPKSFVWTLARWRNELAAAAATVRRSRRTRSPSRRRPSCARASSTPTRCPTTRCSTR